MSWKLHPEKYWIEKPLLTDRAVWNDVRMCSVNRQIIMISTLGIFDYSSLVDDWISKILFHFILY